MTGRSPKMLDWRGIIGRIPAFAGACCRCTQLSHPWQETEDGR